jgi:hypothetical protein
MNDRIVPLQIEEQSSGRFLIKLPYDPDETRHALLVLGSQGEEIPCPINREFDSEQDAQEAIDQWAEHQMLEAQTRVIYLRE